MDCAALQASTIAIIALGGRLPQIMLNARRGNSGELSPLTSILNLAGNAARLFTTAVLTKVATNPGTACDKGLCIACGM